MGVGRSIDIWVISVASDFGFAMTTCSLMSCVKFSCLPSTFHLHISSKRDRNPQESCRNGSGIPARAFVLAVEQLFQLFLQVSRSAVLFCGFECIHGWPVVFPEFIHQR